jgi:3-dehydroquinate synthetase
MPKERDIVTIIDNNVNSLYGHLFNYPKIIIDSNEKIKTTETVDQICSQLLFYNVHRSSIILIIGGGIVTDMGAFAASVYFRGVDFILMPTTVLAQVDAAIGGKCGVNLNGYKNIIGLFSNPLYVTIVPDFLKSLPEEQIKYGLSEMLKTFIIFNKDHFIKSVSIIKRGIKSKELYDHINSAAKFKSQIVNRDPYENGERALLNLGHTFAHAIEKLHNMEHGHAVAIGISISAKLSSILGLLKKDELDLIMDGLNSLNLELDINLNVSKLIYTINSDKKRINNLVNIILIKQIGECTIYPIEIKQLEELLYDMS